MGMFKNNSDEITRAYMDSLLVESRYIDSETADSKMELFGETFETPIMTAALSHLNGTSENGMTVYAEGAKIANAVHWVGMGDDAELEAVVATGARTIKIVKPLADNDEIIRELKHAENAGCLAVGMDIDHSFSSDGNYDNVAGIPMKSKSMEELREFVKSVSIPFIVKGVLSSVDALKCVDVGAAGIQISHHHGIMPYSVPPLMVLPEIKKVTEGKIKIFIDCGFESGVDVFKALALGADAVSVGRHLMPLLKNGPKAVADRIVEMNCELRGMMSRTGITSLSKMDSGVIHHTAF